MWVPARLSALSYAWLLVAALAAAPAAAAEGRQVAIRLGVHPGYARIVFDLPPGTTPSVAESPGHVSIAFPDGVRIAAPSLMPPHVLGFTVTAGKVDITLEPGIEIKQAWPDGRLVLDVMAPSAGQGAAQPDRPAVPAATEPAAAPDTPKPIPRGALRSRARIDRHRAGRAPVPSPVLAPSPETSDRDTLTGPSAARQPRRAPAPGKASPAGEMSAGEMSAGEMSAGPYVRAPTALSSAGAPAPASTGRPEPDAMVPSGVSPSSLAPPAQTPPAAAPPAAAPPAAAPATPTSHTAVRLAMPEEPANAAARTGLLPAPLTPVTAEPLPAPQSARQNAPISLRANELQGAPDTDSTAFAVPFDQHVAAAAFRRGRYAYIVFDQARPIDLAGLRGDPALAEASATVLPAATVIRLPLPAGRGIALAPAGERWIVRLTALAIPPRPTAPRLADGRLVFTLESPGAVVAVPDPETGALLLVGTQRKPGQGIAAPRRTPGFALLPSWQGIALEPFSDTLTLQTTEGGFALAATDGLALLPRAEADAQSDAALLTRRYDFPALPPDALLQRLKAQIESSAEAPPLARAPLRRLAAQTLIALGMGAEAQGLLDLAATDDPRAADDPDQIGLSAIAALLAGRMKETDGLDDPRLADTDEIALWRAARLARQHQDSPEAAATFAANVKLALAYPAPLRAHLLPLIAETMAAGGEAAAAKALLAGLPSEPGLALARAMLAQSEGDTAAALAGYDAITRSNDRLARARAAPRAIELRLTSHAIDAAGAAAAYDKLLAAWRGDGREFALRLRLADLRAEAGEWRSAFALLRETAAAFPDNPAAVAREKSLFTAFVQGDQGAHLAPLDFVAFVDENADLMPDGSAGDALADRLADRLAQLDLPTRAASLLQKLIDHAKTPQARAAFGARLAELRLGNGDGAGAQSALVASDAPGLPDDLAERRALTAARADAKLGNVDAALAALNPFSGADVLSVRAHILEDAKDWPRALSALADLVARVVPPDGPLDDAGRRLLLRLASAAAAAGDTATLARLRDHDLPRFGNGGDADMLRVLTEAPIASVNDLPRARREEQSALSVAARLAQAAGATTPESSKTAPAAQPGKISAAR